MSAGDPEPHVAAALEAAWRGKRRIEIAFGDGEIVTADEATRPIEDEGRLIIIYRLLATNRPEKYARFGAPPRAAYVAKLEDIRSVRLLPHLAGPPAGEAEGGG